MIIDAHCHVGGTDMGPDRLVENMDRCGIDRAWLLTVECTGRDVSNWMKLRMPAGHYENMFHDVLAARRMFPDRFVAGYIPDFRRPDALERLGCAHEHGARVCGELKIRAVYDSPDALRVYKAAGDLGMPVIMHLDVILPPGSIQGEKDQWWFGGSLDAVLRAVEACPGTTFIGHAPGFWRHISGDADECPENYPQGPVTPGGRLFETLDKLPNLYAEFSADSGLGALKRSPEVAEGFLVRFQDKVLFGRDTYHNEHKTFIDGLGLPAEVYDKIMGGNARKLVPAGD